ncbi:MAG: hypothetical protein LBU08_03935, partial [Tannerellaceae bacterium]|nr:hypothetical protein [Tannerellaceae bacterium]
MNKKWFLNASLSAAVGLALAAPWATTQADELYLQAQELKSGDNKEGTIFTFPSVVEWVDNTGDNPVTKIDFEGLNSIAPGTTNFEWTKAGTSPNNGNEGFAFVIKIEKPWKKGQAGEAVILSLKVGKSAEIPKDITIPEFVWAHDKERSGDEAFPSYKVVGIADTVFRVFTKAGDNGLEINSGNDGYTKLATSSFTGFKNLWVSPRIPKILGSGKLKTYGLFQGEVYNASNYVSFESVLIQPTWAVLENNQKLTSGTAYYRNSTGQVEGAESVVRDLQFGLSGDNRDLEVSKADLDAISKFIAVATPVKAAANSKNKGQLIKLSTATLHIGLGLKPASGAFDTPEDGGDVLPNKWLSLGADAFKADSLSWRFGSIIIHNEVSGNLGAAGFASISPIHKLKEPKDNVEASVQAPDFELIDLSTVNLKIPNSGVFAIEGDGLFQGLTIGVPGASTAVTGGLVLPAGLQAIGNKWFKDATIFAIGDKVDATSKAVTVTNLGASVTFIGDEAFRGAFIGNFDKLGTALGTPATYEDNHSGEYPYLKNGLTIGKSAFKGYKIYLKLKDASSFEANKAAGAFSLESFKRATVIGDSAFADLTHAHLTFDGTNVEADASGATTEHHFYPVTNFGKLTLVNTLGKGVFAEDHIALAASDVVNVPQTTDALKAILFPSTYLASSPSAIFKNAAFVVGGTSGQYITAPTKIEEYLDEGINFKTSLDTFAYKAFKIGEKALPGDGIALDAFPEDTIYVSYKSFEKWKYALTGSKLVVDYGFTGISETDPDKFLVKIVAGSAGVVTNTTKTLGLFEITYNFARNSRARTISFYNAYAAGKRHYSITGPTSAIGAVPGFLTLKADSTPKAIEITEAFSEDGLVLDPFTPAGLYVISVYGFSEPTTADINNDNVTGKETYLLRVLPADLLRYTADTVELGYVGADNVAAALKHKFTIPFFAGLIHNEYGDEEDLSYDGADIKVYDEAALALKADGEVVDNVLVVKGKGSYVNELAIPLKYTPRSIAQVDFSIPPVDFKIGDKEFLIPGDLKFAVTEEDTIYTLTIPQTGGEDDTYITVAYDASTPTGKPGTVKVKLTGKGELTGSADETYEIKANWAAFAAFPTTGPKYQVSDIPV